MESHTQGDLLRTTESVWGLQEKTATCSPWANFLNLQIKFYRNTAILINSYIICSCSWGTTAELSSHNREHMAHIAPNIYSLTEKVCWSPVYSIKSIYFKPLSTKERLELKKQELFFQRQVLIDFHARGSKIIEIKDFLRIFYVFLDLSIPTKMK